MPDADGRGWYTLRAADMVYHILNASSLNDLGAILPVVKTITTH